MPKSGEKLGGPFPQPSGLAPKTATKPDVPHDSAPAPSSTGPHRTKSQKAEASEGEVDDETTSDSSLGNDADTS